MPLNVEQPTSWFENTRGSGDPSTTTTQNYNGNWQERGSDTNPLSLEQPQSWFDNAGGRGDTLGVYENTDTRYNEGTRYFQPDNQFQNNQYGSTSSVQAESSWFDKSTNWYNNEPLV